jgi:cytochrome c-type biogenesis protein CcmH/NrfG
MKDLKSLLASSIEVVTFLLAAFGGFLKRIAPPDQTGASYAVGVMSFLTLIALMIVSAIARNKPGQKARKNWIQAGIVLFLIAIVSSFAYPSFLGQYTFPQQSEPMSRRISAADSYLTPDAQRYKHDHPQATAEELIQNLPDDDVWTRAGITRAQSWLLLAYASLVLSLAGAIFCLLEANLSEKT